MKTITAIALLIITLSAWAGDTAVDAIVKRYETEGKKAKEVYDRSVKRSADYAIKKLEKLEKIKAKAADADGLIAIKAAIAKIKGEEFDPGDMAEKDDNKTNDGLKWISKNASFKLSSAGQSNPWLLTGENEGGKLKARSIETFAKGEGDKEPWCIIDLGVIKKISRVDVEVGHDGWSLSVMRDCPVYISKDGKRYKKIGKITTDVTKQEYVFKLPVRKKEIQYINIQQPTGKHLSLCTVKVYGE